MQNKSNHSVLLPTNGPPNTGRQLSVPDSTPGHLFHKQKYYEGKEKGKMKKETYRDIQGQYKPT